MSDDKAVKKTSGSKKSAVDNDNSDKAISQLESILKDNKDFHYNDGSEDVVMSVSTGSLILDAETSGGIKPSILRMTGISGGGKTSCTLAILKNFLESNNGKQRKAIYYKAEGRLSHEVQERSGVNFVEKPSDWQDGTCFIFKSNVYEVVVQSIKDFIQDNPDKNNYFFIVDSTDALIPKADINKSFDEVNKVGGGATLASHFLRVLSLPLSTGGHYCALIGQVRSTVQTNKYAKTDPKLTNASGGNALTHYPEWIFEFQPRYKDDYILDSKGNSIGHWAKLIFRKTTNEKDGKTIKYPIKHGQKDGTSVWIEYEITDCLLGWEYMTKAGSWMKFTPEFLQECSEAGFEIPESVQGMDNVKTYLEENPELTKYLFRKFSKLFDS